MRLSLSAVLLSALSASASATVIPITQETWAPSFVGGAADVYNGSFSLRAYTLSGTVSSATSFQRFQFESGDHLSFDWATSIQFGGAFAIAIGNDELLVPFWTNVERYGSTNNFQVSTSATGVDVQFFAPKEGRISVRLYGSAPYTAVSNSVVVSNIQITSPVPEASTGSMLMAGVGIVAAIAAISRRSFATTAG